MYTLHITKILNKKYNNYNMLTIQYDLIHYISEL
jgi:hypothetical protein